MGNEKLAEMEPLARLLFIYLWMLADREGRLEDRPKRIAAQALPYDHGVNIDKMLDGLHNTGFILRYESNSIKCIQILAFSKHQAPHIREAASELPMPDTTKAQPRHNLGSAQASPRSPDVLIPEPLSSDSLKPDTKAPKRLEPPDGVLSQTWADFLILRKAKKSPMTETALNQLEREAKKAGMSLQTVLETCCQRGWAGFKADWLNNGETAYQKSMREKVETVAPSISARKDPNDWIYGETHELARLS
jgi:hypothetical protein